MRGAHIYNPRDAADQLDEIVSLTVIGPDVLEADRMATAAFAMGRLGVYFIEALPDFEAYMIDRSGQATMTTHFSDYVCA
jgi:thiamine biosynthesis lipoprotein